MTVPRSPRSRPRAVTLLFVALVVACGLAAPERAVAQAPPPVAAPTDAPPDPVISEAARRSSLGRDLLAVLGDRLTAQKVDENEKRGVLDNQIANLDWRRRVRQSLLERIAVDTADLTSTRRSYQGHMTNMVDLVQGSLFVVADGTRLLVLDPEEATQQKYNSGLYDAAAAFLKKVMREEAARIKGLETSLVQTRAQVAIAESFIHAAEEAVANALATYQAAKAVREEIETLIRKLSTSAFARYPGIDINLIVLDAYLRAARRVDAADRACGLEWWAIAAVGWVETGHARGRAMDAYGTVLDEIIGPTLDGTEGNQVVLDTDQGALDGDPVYDHGVGPMQFIPETWKNRGADGNNDGYKDPYNFYDAALATARMLCASRGDHRLSTVTGFGNAVFAYNNSKDYVRKVTEIAIKYQKGELMPSREVSVIAGGIPGTSANEIVRQLTDAGWQPKVLSVGDPKTIATALTPREAKEPVVLSGLVLAIADPAWTPEDQFRVLADVTRASNGLRVVWIPTTPFAKRSAELEKAYSELLAANPQVQLGSSVIPPRTPWCGSLAACPGWAEWLDLVLAQLG
jgi:membrane-bound lytic murein transglycosylase B